jgi:hypothetical protein
VGAKPRFWCQYELILALTQPVYLPLLSPFSSSRLPEYVQRYATKALADAARPRPKGGIPRSPSRSNGMNGASGSSNANGEADAEAVRDDDMDRDADRDEEEEVEEDIDPSEVGSYSSEEDRDMEV